MSETIGFIGLGQLGFPIADNLIDAGYALLLHNRTAHKADPLIAKGAVRVDRPADTVRTGGIVVSILWGDASVEETVMSTDFLERLGPGGVHVSMSTISPDMAGKLAAEHARHGSSFVEAPIFGRPASAVARTLWFPFSGPQAAKARVRPLLDAMGAQGVFDFGEAHGAAAMVKVFGNYLLISAGATLREGRAIVEKAGFDPQPIMDMLTATLFPGPIYKVYGGAPAAAAVPVSGQPVGGIAGKDLGIFLDIAQGAGIAAPLSGFLRDLQLGRIPRD